MCRQQENRKKQQMLQRTSTRCIVNFLKRRRHGTVSAQHRSSFSEQQRNIRTGFATQWFVERRVCTRANTRTHSDVGLCLRIDHAVFRQSNLRHATGEGEVGL